MNASNEQPEYVYTVVRVPDKGTRSDTEEICLVRWPVDRVNAENYAVVIPSEIPEQYWFRHHKRVGRRLYLPKGDGNLQAIGSTMLATKSLIEAEAAWRQTMRVAYWTDENPAGGPVILHAFGSVDPNWEARTRKMRVAARTGEGDADARTQDEAASPSPRTGPETDNRPAERHGRGSGS